MISQKKLVLSFLLCVTIITSVASCGSEPALKDIFAEDFLIGAAVNEDQIYGKNAGEAGIISKHFNTITSENILKWESVHPEPETFCFDAADKFVELGEQNKMFIVGHALVWHHQTPDWVFENADGKLLSREALLERMKTHIFAVAGRYDGRIHAWDVVNEAFEDDGSLRNSKWLQIIGEDYIEKAFIYAHQAAPNTELYYNDYGMFKEKKWQGVVRLVKKLKSKGVRIDGVGLQGHWGFDNPLPGEAEPCFEALKQLGVKAMITEMDMTVLPWPGEDRGAEISQNYELKKEFDPYPRGLPAEMQKQLAARYAELFSMLLKYRDVVDRVTFWGVQDGNSWRNDWPVEGRTDYPLLFDRNCKPKPALRAVAGTGMKRPKQP